jgi:hypothetical protein
MLAPWIKHFGFLAISPFRSIRTSISRSAPFLGVFALGMRFGIGGPTASSRMFAQKILCLFRIRGATKSFSPSPALFG